MKIVIVSHYFSPHKGGIEVVVQKYAESWVKNGDKAIVVTSQTAGSVSTTSIENGVVVHREKANNFFDIKFGIPYPIVGVNFILRLVDEIRQADFVHIQDVFYIPSWWAYFIASYFKKPIVLTQHVALVKHQSSLVMWLQKCVYGTIGKTIFKNAKSIIVYNAIVKKFLESQGVKMGKVYELRNGVDLKFYTPTSSQKKLQYRKELGLPLTKPIILFAGRLVEKKGINELFKARSNEFDIVFAGSGVVPKKWRKEPGVHFIGAYGEETILKLYQSSTIFVFPAVGEIFTIVMQEAMACGLPVITTNDPGYSPYQINRKLISLIPNNPKNIRMEILRVLDNKHLHEQMSGYSLYLSKKWFDWEDNFLEIVKIFSALQK